MAAPGDSSISALFLDHREPLVRLLFRMIGCRATAEDLAQEAYLRLVDTADDGRVAYPRPYLYQIARNLALDYLRREKVRGRAGTAAEDEEAIAQAPSFAPGPEQAASAQEQVDLLLAAMGGLSERRRQILLLHKIHHWSYDRIAEHLGLSRSAVEKNLYAALAHLLAATESAER